ncbi:MAG: hypothetical protein ACXWT5_09025 [Methylophilus sp.]
MSPGWTTWVMGVLVISALLVVMNEVSSLKRQIELANHVAEVNRIRAALVEHWVHQQVQPPDQVRERLAGVNPMRLMLKVPLHYMGEYESPPIEFKNIWFFDVHQKCLVYIFDNGEFAAYRMTEKKAINGIQESMMGDWRLVIDTAYQSASHIN